MARLKNYIRVDPVQGWIRCRIPVGTCLPNNLSMWRFMEPRSYQDQRSREWPETLLPLTSAAGYFDSFCSRNTDDPEDVLFIASWKDEESLEAFAASPGYTALLKALGMANLEFRWSVIKPPHRDFGQEGAIFILSFPHPINDEDRKLLGYLELPVRIVDGRTPEPNLHYYWFREPQQLEDGQMVEQGSLIHTRPDELELMVPQFYPRIFRCGANLGLSTTLAEREETRERWERYVERVKPLRIEEVIWDPCVDDDYLYDLDGLDADIEEAPV